MATDNVLKCCLFPVTVQINRVGRQKVKKKVVLFFLQKNVCFIYTVHLKRVGRYETKKKSLNYVVFKIYILCMFYVGGAEKIVLLLRSVKIG